MEYVAEDLQRIYFLLFPFLLLAEIGRIAVRMARQIVYALCHEAVKEDGDNGVVQYKSCTLLFK